MKIIGLTGGIASGKSTVTTFLKECGAIIIDADVTAHKVIEPYKPAWADIVESFGQNLLKEDMTIDREKLGEIVFSQPDRLQKLNQITHPRVMESLKDDLLNIKSAFPRAVVVLDMPLLLETHYERICDEVWVVWVDAETQINRLMKRNNYSRREAILRVESQMPLDEKAKLADVVINNQGTIEETIHITSKYYNAILQDV